jgi:flagellar biosynthesis GTPase FlhF
MSVDAETTVYRGSTLEELLPKIRDELGSDAVIVRQREGIVGGVGGFFGKKCVEVEARPAQRRTAMPSRAVVDAYDTGESYEPAFEPLPEPEAVFEPAHEPAFEPAPAPAFAPEPGNQLLETLMAQTSPFGDELAELLVRTPDEPELQLDPLTVLEAERPSALGDIATRPMKVPAPARPAVSEADVARANMEAAGIPASLIDEIFAEIERTVRPFEPFTSYRELARRALTERIPVVHGWKTKRRTIALLGLADSGRTLTAAKLCQAYARAGRSVTALSLEPARDARRLGELTDRAGVALEIADSLETVRLAKRRARNSDLVVVDTPALGDPVDGRRVKPLLRMLEELRPDETHLLVPATADAAVARAFVGSLLRQLTPTRILVTHTDARPHTGVAVGLAVAENIPVSFVTEGDRPVGGVTLAGKDDLARMVLA